MKYLVKLRARLAAGPTAAMDIYEIKRDTGGRYIYKGEFGRGVQLRTLSRDSVGVIMRYPLRRSMWIVVEAEDDMGAMGDPACTRTMRKLLRELREELEGFADRLQEAAEANGIGKEENDDIG